MKMKKLFFIQKSHWRLTLHFDENATRYSLGKNVGIRTNVKYVADSLGERILYKYRYKNQQLKTYCVAYYAGDNETRNSTTGYISMMGEGPVPQCSKRQPKMVVSSTEAEIISSGEFCKEAMFLK